MQGIIGAGIDYSRLNPNVWFSSVVPVPPVPPVNAHILKEVKSVVGQVTFNYTLTFTGYGFDIHFDVPGSNACDVSYHRLP